MAVVFSGSFSDETLDFFKNSNIQNVLNLGSGDVGNCIVTYQQFHALNNSIKLVNVDTKRYLSKSDDSLDYWFRPGDTFESPDDAFVNWLEGSRGHRIEAETEVYRDDIYNTVLNSFKAGRFLYVEKDIREFLKTDNNTYDLIIMSKVLSVMRDKEGECSTVSQNFNNILKVIETAHRKLNKNGLLYLRLNCQAKFDQFNEEHISIIRGRWSVVFEQFKESQSDRIIILKK